MSNHKSYIPGIILILIGLYLFSQTNNTFDGLWPYIYPVLMLGFASLMLFNSRRHKKETSLYWGTFLTLIGLFFLLRNYELIPYYYASEYWPIVILSFGISSITLFIRKLTDFHSLIWGIILITVGLVAGSRSMDLYYWDYGYWLERYWPLAIILIGAGLIGKGIVSENEKKIHGE